MASPMARLHVHGRMRAICERIVADRRSRPSQGKEARAATEPTVGRGATLQSLEQFHSEASPIKPQRLMKELSRRFPPGTRFLADSGNSMMWAAHYLQPANRRGLSQGAQAASIPVERERRSGTASWLRIALEFAPMGWAIGAAVGIARANPRGPVVCITGDGSYLMNGQEITTAAQERLGYRLPRVDFRKLAEAMAIRAHVVESPADFESIDFQGSLSREGPTLIDVRIDGEEVPPMKMRLKTLGSIKE